MAKRRGGRTQRYEIRELSFMMSAPKGGRGPGKTDEARKLRMEG